MVLLTPSRLNFASAIATLPTLFVAPPVAPEALQLIKEILEEYYFDGIDDIVSAELDGGDIVGEFTDRVGARSVKRYQYKITDDEVSYGLLNSKEVAKFAVTFVPMFGAGSRKGKKKTCANSTPCGDSCIQSTKKCRKKTGSAVKAKIKEAKEKLGGKEPKAKKAPAPISSTKAIASDTAPKIITNSTALDAERTALVDRFGSTQVEAAEANVARVLADSSIFIRVGSESTLETILGDRFKTSAELGTKDHDIPYLKGGYDKARKRVEERVLGIGAKAADGDRPIYGYFGGDDLSGTSHAGASRAYGGIAVKLKPEAKERATFTGADSFKSGTASEAIATGTPPPPNAASIVASTRHGYDRADLPKHYPEYYRSDKGDRNVLKSAANARDIDVLATSLASTGNAYVEAQVHGGVSPKDIAELHFTDGHAPTKKIAELAKTHGITIYRNGKKLSAAALGKIKDPPPPLDGLEKARLHTTEAVLKGVRAKLVDTHGEALVLKAEANMREVLDRSELYLRCEPTVIDKILNTRFKSQFETGTSGGALTKSGRARTEKTIFNYSKTATKPEDRPIYGYLGDSADEAGYLGHSVSHYGSIVVRLKKTSAERATFTRADSLRAFFPASSKVEASIGAVSSRSSKRDLEKIADAYSIEGLKNALGGSGYIEAQMHGKVTPDDIEEIIYREGDKPSKFALKFAKSKGITISVK